MYAVAVRDGHTLLLHRLIRYSATGAYVLWPHDDPEGFPHSTYHTDGKHHQKSGRRTFLPRKRQKIDDSFRGTEQVIQTPIYLSEVHSINRPCDPEKFSGVFEIPGTDLSPDLQGCRTSISVDVIQPGSPPLSNPGSRVVRQMIFKDTTPHLCVSLWEMKEDHAGRSTHRHT